MRRWRLAAVAAERRRLPGGGGDGGGPFGDGAAATRAVAGEATGRVGRRRGVGSARWVRAGLSALCVALLASTATSDECAPEYARLQPLSTLDTYVYFNDLNTSTIAGANASTSSYFNSFKLLMFPKRTSEAFWCNGSSTAVLCQLAAFDRNENPFNNEIPVETTLARGGNAPDLWRCTRGGLSPALYPHGAWQLRSVQNVSSPFIRQAKLLTQANSFITAISSADGDGILVNREVDSSLCQTLSQSSAEFNISCHRPQLGVMLRRLVQPIMNETISDSEEDVSLATTVTYACAPGVRGPPQINLTEGTRAVGVANTSGAVQLEFNVTVSHECCCDDATTACRNGYEEHIAIVRDRAQCDTYAQMEFRWIGFFGVAIFVLVLVFERRAAETYERLMPCESITVHPMYVLKDALFFLNILSPVNLMENRRGSVVVACIFGTLAALIFTEIVQPNGAQFLRATLWLFLLYPLFLCRSCHHKLAGSVLGLIYCLVFTFFMWLRLSCRWNAQQHDQALFVLIPALCCNIFIGWFGLKTYKELRDMANARQDALLSRANSVGSDDVLMVGRPRALTLSDQGTHQQYDHNELVMALLVPARQQRREATEESERKKSVLEQVLGFVLSYGADFRKSYNYFRYSPRMLVMAAMSWCMLFNFMVYLGFLMQEFVPWGEEQLSGGLCCGGIRCHHGDEFLWTKWTENSTLTSLLDAGSGNGYLGGGYDDCAVNLQILNALRTTLVLSGFLMAVAHAASVVNLVAVYRKHMMRFYRGQKTFLSKFIPGPYIALTDCLKYVSYQVIFVICGWVFSTVLVGAAFMFVAFTVILPAQGAYEDAFWPWLWSTYCWDSQTNEMGPLMLTLVLYGIMMAMVWYCFMDRTVNMALTNRTLWDTFDLFQTIANFLVGFFMFIKRILVQILFGVLFISRLDKPLVPRGYEFWDPGFACYQGFLLVEMYYSNPVMLTFVQILADAHIVLHRKAMEIDDGDVLAQHGSGRNSPGRRTSGLSVRAERIGRTTSQAVKRWHLTYTLVRNPELAADRRQSLPVARIRVEGSRRRGWFGKRRGGDGVQMVPVHVETTSRYDRVGVNNGGGGGGVNDDDDDDTILVPPGMGGAGRYDDDEGNGRYESDGYMTVEPTFHTSSHA